MSRQILFVCAYYANLRTMIRIHHGLDAQVRFSTTKDTEQFFNRIVELVNDAFFEWDNGVVRNRDMFRTDLRTTFGDVTISNTIRILQFFQPVFSVNWVHFQGSGINEESRSDELVMEIVFSKDMTDILTEEALNALAKLLDVVNVFLFHPPRTIFGIRGSWREGFHFLFNLEVP